MAILDDRPWILTVDPARATGTLREAYECEAMMVGAPTELTRLGSLFPDLAIERLRLHQLVEDTPSTLTPLERGLAAYVTSTLNGDQRWSELLARKLVSLNAPDWLLDNIRGAAGQWGVSDDDRIEVIVMYAAQLTRTPANVTRLVTDRLRAVGLSDLDILDLNNVVAYYNYVNRVENGLSC